MQLRQGTLLQGGRYKIERMLGQGGFGITYLAIQSGLERKVAVKEFFMREHCERDERTSHVTLGTKGSRDTVKLYRVKFLKEARNIAKLDHPNIVSIIDVFEENGTAYYVMKYAENGSLADKVKREGYLSEQVATRYILQIADALAYIHERKMNHLDVKPGNIMLNNNDETVLIDFGLSKQYDMVTEGQTSATPVAISRGYAPMEQYRDGGVSKFSPQTDIYSLGATYFKLLTGVTPPSAFDIDENGLPIEELKEKGVSQTAISVISHAMESRKKDRMADVRQFIKSLTSVTEVVDEDEATTIVECEEAAIPMDGLPINVNDVTYNKIKLEIDTPSQLKKNYLARVKKNDKWGFIDKNGKIVIPCTYEDAESYSEGMAQVEKDGKYGFIDKNGKIVIPCIYEDAWSYSEGMARVEKDGKYGFIDKNGKIVIPCIYGDADHFREGLAPIMINNKWGFIEKNGEIVVPCIYDKVEWYCEGMALVEKNKKCGFIDKYGTLVVPDIYEFSTGFSEGVADVEKDGKWGVIDKTGMYVVPCIYDDIGFYQEGLASIEIKGKYGFINKSGSLVVPCIYDDADYYSEGMAKVKKDEMWGFIDKNGKIVVPCIYDYVYPFHDGLACVEMNGKYGFINQNGMLVVPCIYDHTYYFYEEGLVQVKMNGKYGFIDKNGTLVVPCIYDDADSYREV